MLYLVIDQHRKQLAVNVRRKVLARLPAPLCGLHPFRSFHRFV